MIIHTLNNTEKSTYWEHVVRAETAKGLLSEKLCGRRWNNKDEIQAYVNNLVLSDDEIIALRMSNFGPDNDGQLRYNIPSTQDVRDALFNWEDKGQPKMGRKLHIVG